MQKAPEVELVNRLCDDLTKDIKNLSNKQWLVPSLVSHVATLIGSEDQDRTERFVFAWYRKTTSVSL